MKPANRTIVLTALGVLAATLSAPAAVVVEYSFEGNLNDTAAGGGVADNTWAMEAFVKVSAHNPQWERLIVKWGVSNNYHFALETKDLNFFSGNPVGNIFDANTAPVTNFTDGSWHHIAFTSSASGSQAWIDGTSVFTGGAITLANGTDPLGIGDFGTGGSNDGLRMHGFMDEIRIHDSPVDQAYINGRMALIPEPASAAFLGLAGLSLLRRRR